MAMATREQELKALARIKKIVEELGEGSYIGMAFEGCFEIAEDNIRNDFGCSMKQRAEKAERDAEYFRSAADHEAAEVERLTKETEELKARTLTTAETGKIKSYLYNAKMEAARVADSTAAAIVELADNPKTNDFAQAVGDNRTAKKRITELDELIQKLLETMK